MGQKNKNSMDEKYIANLEFLKDYEGVYCYKNDKEGNLEKQAYFYTSCKRLIIVENENYTIYDWNSIDINKQNESRHVISQFLSELTVAPYLTSKGTPYEKKIAESCWQLYRPQDVIPYLLEGKIKEIQKNIIETE